MKPDTPKLHFAWSGTNSGISNPSGEKHRIYYGKTFRIPRDATLDVEKHHEIENRELDELTANAIDQSCADGGKPAVSEFLERYDVLDVETGDVLVMYRVPYKPDDEKRVQPTTAPPTMSRKARRSAAKRGEITGDFLNCPPNASQEARVLIGRILRLVEKRGDFKIPADLAAEQRALALLAVAVHEVASMADSTHKRAVADQMGIWFQWLLSGYDEKPEMPPLDEAILEDLEAAGIAETFVTTSDEEDRTH